MRVIDRCNLACEYCSPPDGIKLMKKTDLLTFEQIVDVVQAAVKTGICKIRLTGGEPLLRKDICLLVELIDAIEGVKELCLTTNGTHLADLAGPLAQAGIQRVNISLDTTIPHRYTTITRGGDIRDVLAGIDAAIEAGLTPIKLNCVIGKETDEALADLESVRQLGRRLNLQVRRIECMDFDTGHFGIVESGLGGNCPQCNRIRLSSDGFIRPCLFSDLSFSVREFGPGEAIRMAIESKPERGQACTHDWMRGIGG